MRQNIYSVAGITVIEDCYNASPESMSAAISVLGDTAKAKGGRMIALLGDMRELGSTTEALHAGVGSCIAKQNPAYLFTYGALSSANLADGAVQSGMSESQVFRNPQTDPENVGKKLLSVLKAGDVLLVKASRGLEAEKVLNYVKAQLV
jgi:UDP-N-acetylmuramoyl-tripeptide--D-alanyl-D-alanine ligase